MKNGFKQVLNLVRLCRNEYYGNAELTLKQVEGILNQYKDFDMVPIEAKEELIRIVSNDDVYMKLLERQVVDKKAIHTNEIVLHVEYGMTLRESKNRCKMVETGYRYERKPVWNESNRVLDKNGRVILTDKAIYLYVGMQTMRYPYSKIVNYGFEKTWGDVFAYFDVKTSSPFPHRFEMSEYLNETKSRKEQNICLFLHCLCSK